MGKVYFHHSLGELMTMAYVFSRVYRPIKRLALVNNQIKTVQGATQRVFEIMGTVADIRDRPQARQLHRHREAIVFDGVSFGYSPQERVLNDVSFYLKQGLMVAFVGSTGAGKSTLLSLVPRFYDARSPSLEFCQVLRNPDHS